MNSAEIIKLIGTFLAIMNPLANLPVFLVLTTGLSVAQQRTVAVKVAISSAITSLIIILAGGQILDFFGINISTFRVAGGFVLASIAWSLLKGTQHSTQQEDSKSEEVNLSVLAFYPITFPIIVGPGTIASIMIYTSNATHIKDYMPVLIVLAIMIILTFLVFFYASYLGKLLTNATRMVTMKLMGLILLAIAIEMAFDGILKLFPGLG